MFGEIDRKEFEGFAMCEENREDFEDREFYNGIMVFMIVSLKKSIPFVIKSCPKTKINSKWIFSSNN